MLSKQSIDKQQVSVFLRDLTSDFNINLKHIIEILLKQVEKSSLKLSQEKQVTLYHNTTTKYKEEIDIEDDKQKIDYLMDSFPTKELISKIVKLKTDEAKDALNAMY